ncbi:Probable plastid-lipid-associated protein 11 [Striga hermonthica]|uniref:Probable plastid-lipid-associated protein 11 n=1 Tax=Striga hermonthica TaxID=68872 RepID=A0A9N7P132_STRHE|nr:Probable plastid-lipid-associated protein 11 [Striga hermonthica]
MATNSLSLPAISNFSLPPRRSARVTRLSLTDQSQSPSVDAKHHLLRLIAEQDRGLKTQSDTQRLSQIIEVVDSLPATSRGSVTTGESHSDTWLMLWTTEKEQLFIVKNALVFGTSAGDVLQVINVEQKTLNNVITFPPDGLSRYILMMKFGW